MTYPIPVEAFDDRLAVTGTSGAGKTYAVLGALARLLKMGRRAICWDPLGVMYGLRLQPDGITPSALKPVIFGGPHGDIPINVGYAALIGETLATMAESAIVDLSTIGSKRMERRFMLDCLTALERHANREPVHLILDEADLWAPQRVLDKDGGDSFKLLGKVDNIVRRGRIKGFIPWLITQRPAVLSKDVLSQADGLVAMKLTSSQDRDAIGAWIAGQADRAKEKETLALLPTMSQGEGVIWLPGHQILRTAKFPANSTFDSSRTPKRGESARRIDLKPLDLGKLKERLATVEQEAKANDPAALKAQVAQLTATIAQLNRQGPAKGFTDAKAPKDDAKAARAQEQAILLARGEGVTLGWERGYAAGHKVGFSDSAKLAQVLVRQFLADLPETLAYVPYQETPKPPKDLRAVPPAVIIANDDMKVALAKPGPIQLSPAPRQAPVAVGDDAGLFSTLPKPKRRILEAVQFWRSVGTAAPTRVQVGGVAGYRQTGDFRAAVGALVTAGFLTIPDPGKLSLAEGSEIPDIGMADARHRLLSIMTGPQKKILDVAMATLGEVSRADLAAGAGYAQTGDFRAAVGFLCSMDVLKKPSDGVVEVSTWARKVLS